MSRPLEVPGTDTWTEGDFHVAIAVPPRTRGPLPVLLLLDGHTMFLAAVEHARTVTHVTRGALSAMAVAAAMVRNAERFGAQCAAAGVDTATVVFADEHHVTLVPASLSRALRHLYATP